MFNLFKIKGSVPGLNNDQNIRYDEIDISGGEIHDLVSIVLPVYNQAHLLEESIKSCLDQTYRNIELIIIDDGSTDDIDGVLNKYQDRPSIKIFRQDNQKLPAALTNGFRSARGEFWTWTSADNRYLPTAIEEMVSYLKKNKRAQAVYCDCEIIDKDGGPLFDSAYFPCFQDPKSSNQVHFPKDTGKLNFVHRNFIGACFMYRGWVGKIIGGYNSEYYGGEDYDYWMRINSLFNFRHIDHKKILYQYRWHDKSLTGKGLGATEKVLALIKYDRERRDFFNKKFEYYSAKSSGIAIPGKRLKHRCNSRASAKAIMFLALNDDLHGPDLALNRKNLFKCAIIDKKIPHFDLNNEVMNVADWIMTDKMGSLQALNEKYYHKTLYIENLMENINIIEKIANNFLFINGSSAGERRP